MVNSPDSSPLLVTPQLPTTDVLLVGGKGLRLLDLTAAGFQVPSFVVVPASAAANALEADTQLASLLDELQKLTPESQQLAELAERIRQRIVELPLPSELEQALDKSVESMAPSHLAVRSSAVDEDAADLSFAGLHDSFLFQQGVEQVRQAVKRVWASAYNERALAYRLGHAGQRGIRVVPMAVVVQQMIDARTSGVAFTCHPATYDTSKVVVSSLWGAGEGLVSEGLDADTFVVDKQTNAITSELAEKPERMVLDAATNAGLRREPTPSELRTHASLTESEIGHVTQLAIDLENRYRQPQDLEFCFDHAGELYLLQARPVAGVPEYGPAAGHPLLWDNSNIIESYSGVTSPMTFSFIRRAYTIVYHCFAEVMGISQDVVRQNRGTFENMLGLLRGRVYYNLKNWYRLIRLFPGYQYNSRAMESMMGVKEAFTLDEPEPEASFFNKWFVEFPKLIALLVRSTWNFARIKTIVGRFESNFHEHYDRWRKMDFESLPPHELMKLYYEMESALLWNWKAPIINDFYVMIYFGLLRKLSKNWCKDESDSLGNDLVCGEPGIESAEPAKFLLRLAQQSSGNPELREMILHDPVESLPARVASRDDCQAFEAEMQRYLDLYGFRCMNELKLEEYSLRDRPHVVYQMLRNYLALDDPAALDVAAMHRREQQIRSTAEQRAAESLKGKPIKRWLFTRVLKRARLGVKNRENMRFARTRIYGVVRELLRAMGGRLAEEQLLENREDVFYLTLDEVWDYVKGTAVTTDLAELAGLRRREFDRYRDELPAPDERFTTHGMVYHRNEFRQPEDLATTSDDSQLRGIGVCAGEVTAEVKVIANPSDNVQLAREILVAERTDPGWVPLYPAVSGILIERGSVLSHSAVVAREMGIPTVVGIRGLLHRVKSGDTVHMNGKSGVVEVIDTGSDSATQS
ncbi:PEP/pyruvate-binding domain-containing protein [Aeoliella mucimassa]|uniref:Phosphoenolpyruvate synthase n=1 Tax=Aeoliella mucimassa TaxID=2527972 RepID=A0A518AK39_9BACT|nr:PEP/pyruvate-binding domain-containing protein [Aeoliella mucimassa]QDU55100.1 Phosphoenolpyruvate synthase [Aeoliella mucimassa]